MTQSTHPRYRGQRYIYSESPLGGTAQRRPDRRARPRRQGAVSWPAAARPPAQRATRSRQPRLKPVTWYRQIVTRRLHAFGLAILYTVLRIQAGLRARACSVLEGSGRALHALRALPALRPCRFFTREAVSVAVFLADRRERVLLERQLCTTLCRLRRSAITLGARARVVVVVQHSLDGATPPASMTRTLATPAPETLLISLALWVDGRRLTTDEVVSHLTTRYIDLVSSHLVAPAVDCSIAGDTTALVPASEVGTLPAADLDDATTVDGPERAKHSESIPSEVSELPEAPVGPRAGEDVPSAPAADALLGYVTARARLAGASADDQDGHARPGRGSGSRSSRRVADRGATLTEAPA